MIVEEKARKHKKQLFFLQEKSSFGWAEKLELCSLNCTVAYVSALHALSISECPQCTQQSENVATFINMTHTVHEEQEND